MLNTCSIGRGWKSREGWSRPVLTGERGTLFPIPLLGWGLGLVLWWFFSLDGKECCFLWSQRLVRRLICFASVVRFPDRHDRNRGWFRSRPIRRVGRSEWFCGGHGPGETPGPFPNPEAKAWHGDGTALERVWESSAPPHSTVWRTFRSSPLGDSRKVLFVFAWGLPPGVGLPETPFFVFFRCSFPWGPVGRGVAVVPSRVVCRWSVGVRLPTTHERILQWVEESGCWEARQWVSSSSEWMDLDAVSLPTYQFLQ